MACEFLIDNEKLNYIKDNMSDASLYEQMAEECVELSHALLKAARILRNENPTPTKWKEALSNVEEEYTDVDLVATLLKIHPNYSTQAYKLDRWIFRIKNEKDNINV